MDCRITNCILQPPPLTSNSSHLVAAYYSFIDPERMKGWVGLVSRPTADGLPILTVTHQLQVRCRPWKVRRSETNVLPLSYTTNILVQIINIYLSLVYICCLLRCNKPRTIWVNFYGNHCRCNVVIVLLLLWIYLYFTLIIMNNRSF